MVSGDWVNYIGDYRSMETIMESASLERNCAFAPNGAHILGWRRHLVPNVYFATAVVICRRILDETAADAKLVNQMDNPSGFFRAFY